MGRRCLRSWNPLGVHGFPGGPGTTAPTALLALSLDLRPRSGVLVTHLSSDPRWSQLVVNAYNW
eukprot:2205247-Alexandrium_andersonii.AAC.1